MRYMRLPLGYLMDISIYTVDRLACILQLVFIGSYALEESYSLKPLIIDLEHSS